MPRPITFYMDETGNRHPDKKSDSSRDGRDWFGFGGVLIRGEDNDAARELVRGFADKWTLQGPCHLTDMMAERKKFSFLGRLKQDEREEFWRQWKSVLTSIEAIGLGCVVDRPGYIARGYLQKHPDRWLICRSAFDIAVERAAKIAQRENRKLHVVFEADPSMNRVVQGYFQNLKQYGMGFDAGNSSKYSPLNQNDLSDVLGRVEYKPKTHPLLQLADSYIYAMSRFPYDKKFWLYRHLRDRKRIADFALPNDCLPNMGVKYYCFD